ncbi:MAG: FtsH protease activity modulator HflK [Chloroflexi bacterium]|nr:FtsH protease activity modulator HflK [Chloroflexota bacterium]
MYQPGGGPRQPEMDFEKIMGGIRDGIGRLTQRFGGGGIGLAIILVIGLIFVIWAASGVYTINPGEQAALRRFGSVQGNPITQTGLHWWWPGPIGKKDVVLTSETRRLELGFRSGDNVADTPAPLEAEMISGDLNIVDVQMVVQYDIKNLTDYLFNVSDPGESDRGVPSGHPDGRTLKDAAEAALRLVIGQRSIDDVLTARREEVQASTKQRLQVILDSYESGINITNVQLQDVKAPEEVRDAFDDVLRARQERDTRINQARAYENDIIPRASGNAERIKREAEAFAQSRVARAEGEAQGFISVLDEYNRSKLSQDVTRQRLYLEAMEEILPGISKIIVSPESETVLVLGDSGGIVPLPIGPSAP